MASGLDGYHSRWSDPDSEQDDEDEKLETLRKGFNTRIHCGCWDHGDCAGGTITIGVDAVCLHVVSPYLSNNGGILYDLLQDDDGEPFMEALFFRFECWEEVGEVLTEMVEDTPPVEDPASCLSCDYCDSSIRMGELCVSVHNGEIAFSDRLPTTTTFNACDDAPYIICLSCVRLMVESDQAILEVFTLWGSSETGALSQKGECALCTRARCWRAGMCTCKCHRVQG